MIDAIAAQPQQFEPRPPVEGFSAWFDSADPANIQGAGGNRIGTWKDRSGFGRHVTQATPANQPWRASWNERDVLFTEGQATVLVGPVPLTGIPWTVFLAGANTTTDGVQRTFVSGFYAAGTEWGRVYRPGSNVITLYAGATLSSSQVWERRRPRVVAGTFNGASSQVRVDGRYVNTGSVAGGGGNSTQQSIFGLGLSESWFGWIGELIFYDARTLTESEYQRTEQYLCRKWGIR